jgi:hypothetical protein
MARTMILVDQEPIQDPLKDDPLKPALRNEGGRGVVQVGDRGLNEDTRSRSNAPSGRNGARSAAETIGPRLPSAALAMLVSASPAQ